MENSPQAAAMDPARFDRRTYSRADSYLPMEYRLVPEAERPEVRPRITGGVMIAKPDLTPALENHPNGESLSALNRKMDFVIESMSLQSAEPRPLQFRYVSLSGSGIQFSSPQRPSLGDMLEIRMILVPYHYATLCVYGEVVRVGKQTTGCFINLRFTEISNAIRELIVRYVFYLERELLRKKRGDQ